MFEEGWGGEGNGEGDGEVKDSGGAGGEDAWGVEGGCGVELKLGERG